MSTEHMTSFFPRRYFPFRRDVKKEDSYVMSDVNSSSSALAALGSRCPEFDTGPAICKYAVPHRITSDAVLCSADHLIRQR